MGGSKATVLDAGFTLEPAGVSKQINLEKTVGPDHARTILEEADAAFDPFHRLIADQAIDCD